MTVDSDLLKWVFTTGEIARICEVASRTVSRWFDQGFLKGYRIPGSKDRRIPRMALIKFLTDNGMGTEGLDRFDLAWKAKEDGR